VWDVIDWSQLLYIRGQIGMALEVLWETAAQQEDDRWLVQGLSDNYLQVSALMDTDRGNHIDRVKIEALNGKLLTGVVLK